MRITTWNVNGLRAAIRKGFHKHIAEINPTVLLLQEIRCRPDQLPAEYREPTDWHTYWHPAQKAGYSGTAIWSRIPLTDVQRGLDGSADEDSEGRVIRGAVNGIQVASVYLPSGSSSELRQSVKNEWLKRFGKWTDERVSGPQFILGGDLNIAHTELDIFHSKANEGTSGFLPHEREWFTQLLGSGWSDLIREHFGPMQGPYSWWSNRGKARQLDRGWRIDYLLANKTAKALFQSAAIHRPAGLEVSDHAPVTIDICESI